MSYNFQLVIAMSWGLWFCVDRKGGTGGGGWVHSKGAKSTAAPGLSQRKHLVGTGWAISLLLCTNGLRKQSYVHVQPPFLAVKLFSHSIGATIGQ